jgi:hypothetical protein
MLLGFRVILRFIIDQNDNNALINIQNLFGYGGVNFRSETASCYRYEVTNLNNVPSIIKYLSNFPLKTKKQKAFEK